MYVTVAAIVGRPSPTVKSILKATTYGTLLAICHSGQQVVKSLRRDRRAILRLVEIAMVYTESAG